MKRIGVLGSGDVAKTLATGFIEDGYQVMMGSRTPKKLENWQKHAGPKAKTGGFEQAADFADLLVLAVKGTAAERVIKLCGQTRLKGKTIIDVTNPIQDAAPENGVLQFFTGPNESLMEQLQKECPRANFVKAFNSVGAALMIRPNFGDTKPSMFICGNSKASKKVVGNILHHWGWETEDMGAAQAARAIEPLCMLWCIPGFANNQWRHAFKLLR